MGAFFQPKVPFSDISGLCQVDKIQPAYIQINILPDVSSFLLGKRIYMSQHKYSLPLTTQTQLIMHITLHPNFYLINMS